MVEQYTITLNDGFHGAKNRLKKRRNTSDGTWYYLGLVGQIGYAVAIPLVGGAILGSFIDKQFGWYPKGTVIGIFTGFVISAIGFVRVVLKVIRKQK